ncbi:PREDICTED: metabotropic glutamate receptor 2-like [Priapulus caudatus]|uniref:Metabotropic glutamate receptor 2-like n=1 Tax=Priapulus caudatus TaxID=37621 RepID=A0ABM1EHT4_PRICU|nr:PREDICTED: metabotropic glutamate receptor 2-like [Priapulus caudatus]
MKRHLAAVLLLWLGLLAAAAATGLLPAEQCDVTVSSGKAVINPKAPIIVGSFMEIRHAGENFGCGLIDTASMQVYEAMRWTLSILNQDRGTAHGVIVNDSFVPGVEIGMVTYDTCTKPGLATGGAVDMFPQMQARESDCMANSSKLILGTNRYVTKRHRAAALANLVYGLVGVLQMAFGAPAAEALTYTSNCSCSAPAKRRFSNIASKPQAIAATVRRLGWRYVSIISTADDYGRQGSASLTQLLDAADVCVGVTAEVPSVFASTSLNSYENAVARVATKAPLGGGVVAFVSNSAVARELLSAADRIPGGADVAWVFSDGLGTAADVISDLRASRGVVAVGATPQPTIDSFGIHWATLDETGKEEALLGNPWFKEYFQEAHGCSLPGERAYAALPACPERTFAERQRHFTQSDDVVRVIDAVYAYAEALRAAHSAICGPTYRGVCDALSRITREVFFRDYLAAVSFTYGERNRAAPELYNRLVAFDERGNPSGSKLGVYSYQRTNNEWRFVQVFTFDTELRGVGGESLWFYNADGSLRLQSPTSVCPADCTEACPKQYPPPPPTTTTLAPPITCPPPERILVTLPPPFTTPCPTEPVCTCRPCECPPVVTCEPCTPAPTPTTPPPCLCPTCHPPLDCSYCSTPPPVRCTCPPLDCDQCRSPDYGLVTPDRHTATPPQATTRPQQAVPAVRTETHSQTYAAPESEAEAEPEAETEPHAESDTDTDTDAEKGTRAETGSGAEIASDRQVAYVYRPSSDKVFLNGVLPIHARGDTRFACGPLDGATFPLLAAALYALERGNGDGERLQMGALFTDSCGSAERGRRDAFTFLAGEGVYGDAYSPRVAPTSVAAYLTFDPVEADAVADVARPAGVPVVLASASAPAATPGVLYALPGVDAQMDAISAILEMFSWDMVSLAYTGSDSDASALLRAANARGICVAETLDLETTDAKQVVDALQQRQTEGATVVVVLARPQETRDLLAAAQDASSDFVWIADDRWGDSARVVDGLHIGKGALTLRAETADVPGLRSYVESLTPTSHGDIPDAWFDEFWQRHFRCRLPRATPTLTQYADECDDALRLDATDVLSGSYATQVALAVNATMRGFRAYVQRFCPDLHLLGIDTCLMTYAPRDALAHYIQQAKVGDGDDFRLTDDGSSSVVYGVYNYRRQKGGEFKYEKVGDYRDDKLHLKPTDVDIYYTTDYRNVPTSTCNKITCRPCREQLHAAPLTADDVRADPVVGSHPASAAAVGSGARDRFRFDTGWGIVVTVLSCVGVMLCVMMLLYFCCLSAVVRGSSLVGYLLLLALALLFALNLAFVATPTRATCGIRRFFLGVLYAAIFASMLVKALNIWRRHQGGAADKAVGDTCFSRPGGLLAIALSLVLVQVLVASEWLLLAAPDVAYDGVGVAGCAPYDAFMTHLVFSCVYVMLLLLLTAVFSLLSWNSSENSRESRWVSLACVVSVVTWVAWTLVATSVPHAWRDLAVCVGNLINGYAVLMCVFLRKVWVLHRLRRQEKQAASGGAQTVSDIYYNQPLALSYPDLSASKSQLGYEGGSQFQPIYETAGMAPPLPLPFAQPPIAVDYDGGSQFSPGYPMTGSQGPGYLYLDRDAPDADVAV